MANFARVTVLGIGALAAIALSGCVGGPPAAVVTPAPSESPVFASEEEALAAATEAYAAYLALGSQVASDGGENPERMGQVTAGNAYQQELETFKSMRSASIRGVGGQTFDTVSVQMVDVATGDIVVYLCLDTSTADLIDSDGTSTRSTDRATRFPLLIELEVAPKSGSDLSITESESWSGENFC